MVPPTTLVGLAFSTLDPPPASLILDRGRYAHNGDQTAHLVVLKQEHGMLLVRQVRAHGDGTIYEGLARYAEVGGVWIIQSTETRSESAGGLPTILQESHFSRSAEALEREAPAFFPVLPTGEKSDEPPQ